MLAFPLSSATQYWHDMIASVAKDFHDSELGFAVADEEMFPNDLKALGLEDWGEDVAVGIYAPGELTELQSLAWGYTALIAESILNARSLIPNFDGTEYADLSLPTRPSEVPPAGGAYPRVPPRLCLSLPLWGPAPVPQL